MLGLKVQRFSYRDVDLRAGQPKTPNLPRLVQYGQVLVLVQRGLLLCQSPALLQYLSAALGKFGASESSPTLPATAR